MTPTERDKLEVAADHLEQDHPDLSRTLRRIAQRENTGPCVRCGEPTGRAHLHFYSQHTAFAIKIDLNMDESALLCDSCARIYLEKFPIKLLKS